LRARTAFIEPLKRTDPGIPAIRVTDFLLAK
jgi:hypothetical protein